MYSWTCSCGDGPASVEASWEDAREQGELHVCRAGRMAAEHVVFVRLADESSAA